MASKFPFKKTVFSILGILILLSAFIFCYLLATRASVEDLPPLKNGDVIFQTSTTPQSTPIIIASQSLYSHMGIIGMKNGTPIVIEASAEVREISLQEWIEKGAGGRITIKRFKNLDEVTAKKIMDSAKSHEGKPYDPYFTLKPDRIYCSELAYNAFQDANIDIGKLEKIRDLNINNAAVSALMHERWKDYPPCKSKNIQTFEACHDIILEQELVTPASIAEDPNFELIYTNYP